MIVTDTNIIAYLLLEGTYTSKVKAAFQKDSDWIAPMLWKSEFRNVLALYMRKQLLDITSAGIIIDKAEHLMQGGEYTVSSIDVLSIAESSGCSAYDCEYVALAHEFSTPLVTTDKRLLSSFPTTALSLNEFVEKA